MTKNLLPLVLISLSFACTTAPPYDHFGVFIDGLEGGQLTNEEIQQIGLPVIEMRQDVELDVYMEGFNATGWELAVQPLFHRKGRAVIPFKVSPNGKHRYTLTANLPKEGTLLLYRGNQSFAWYHGDLDGALRKIVAERPMHPDTRIALIRTYGALNKAFYEDHRSILEAHAYQALGQRITIVQESYYFINHAKEYQRPELIEAFLKEFPNSKHKAELEADLAWYVENAEERAWTKLQRPSFTPKAVRLRSFLEAYPNGTFSATAQEQLDKLE